MAISSNPSPLTMGKCYIKRADNSLADWNELVGTVVSDSITISDDAPTPFHPTRLHFTATLNISRKDSIQLLQSVGLMKRPRLTFKTIKRDCAKRNR